MEKPIWWKRALCAAVVAVVTVGGCARNGGEVASPTATPMPTSTAAPTATDEPVATPTHEPSPTPRATSTVRPTATVTLTPTPRPRPTAVPLSVLATQVPELAPLLNNAEVGQAYKQLVAAYAQSGQQGAVAVAQQAGLLTPEGDIRIDLVLDGPVTEETLARLVSTGIKVLGTQDNRVQIAVPQSLLMSSAQQPGAVLNQLSGIEHVTALLPPQ